VSAVARAIGDEVAVNPHEVDPTVRFSMHLSIRSIESPRMISNMFIYCSLDLVKGDAGSA